MAAIRKPIFVRPLDLGTVICGNARGGHGVQHLNRNRDPGLTWRTDGNGNVWAKGNFGYVQPVDFCAMIAANAVEGTHIRLRLGMSEGAVDGGPAVYDSADQPFIVPASATANGLYCSHLELPNVVNAVWWRIDITGHTGDFEAAGLVLGEKIEPSRYYNLDYEYAPNDLGDIEFTPWGVGDETPGLIWRTVSFTLSWQTEAEYETKFRPLTEALGKRGVIYCCFDPEPSPYRQARTFMGVLEKPVAAAGVRKPRTLEQEFKIISFI
ncbi:hypothetical protein [Caenibius sp. WL]|uniref:hypothetical protein n=1 Tax=Caenibius sp. WL TaxID=2872646 RepID=UPI001C993AA9|nr:hypothetical protein [Caenibius sp. WL]QZP06778.1 hypothetical protein K5X80_08560 [Caenibius sp. WL]